ncbi:DUF3667 domain-containing protein [Maribacter sp. PR1]|uniref:DUF3667 domain-containing protein n=1 Tax=Maribacter cobaltidurans TaxID=1178778 RepID=A0ABU7INB8_9FLAO|nr:MULTISPECIES: DUF3667 domain-containing protein [Maribacter]MDC6387066.1 DUF3667 domain-containing protein [Maribacter sp. PR1]MEE1974452.1 DUF3667 domain-containing protein [Maribacter cobaltidurans]
MQCKNCDNNLRTDYSYCPDCGAKVIRNRLTVKNLWGDVIERYFNLDNTFLKTFYHLFTQPHTVIAGYIGGIRRKYLNPISYLGISITLSGLLVFFMRRNSAEMDMDILGTGTSMTWQTKMWDMVLDYQAIFFVLYIPMMAISGWLNFQTQKYNFSERVVIFMYTLAQYSLAIFIPSLLILVIMPGNYMTFSFVALIFMYAYSAYVIKKVSKDKGLELWSKVIIFCVIFTFFYISLSIILPLILLLTGAMQIEDFRVS